VFDKKEAMRFVVDALK